ncbi:MAG TPA: hypothetical protein VM123_12110 [archaeon]|nr:hypothetical protein [archaeon]
MNKSRKILAGFGLVLALLFIIPVTVTIVFKRGDTFNSDSSMRAVVRLSKRTVAELAGYAVAVWDPYKDSHVYAPLGPQEDARDVLSSLVFSTAEELQNFFDTSETFHGAVVRSFNNNNLIKSRLPFYYQPAGEPMLDSLAALYRLPELVQWEITDFDKFRELIYWLYDIFHTGMSIKIPIPKVDYNFNALDILYRARQGEGFWCSEYSTTLIQCLAALGYTSRYLMLDSGKAGHVLCEAWSETYGKWVMLDPFWGRIVTVDRIPLNVYEIHELFARPERYSRALVWHQGAVLDSETERNFYFDLFRNFAVRMRNDWFTNQYPHWYPLSNSVMNAVEWSDSLTIDNIYYKNKTNCVEDLYWPLNRMKIFIQPAENAGLNLSFATVTPNFSHFLVRLDDFGPEMVKESRFSWKLKYGSNLLKVSAVNSWGIEGRPIVVEIQWNKAG